VEKSVYSISLFRLETIRQTQMIYENTKFHRDSAPDIRSSPEYNAPLLF